MVSPLRDVLSPTVRKPLYIVYGVAGLGLGSTQVGYAAAEAGQPMWLVVALAVYAYIGTAFGFTASSNTPTSRGEVAQAAVEVDETPPPDGWEPQHRAPEPPDGR